MSKLPSESVLNWAAEALGTGANVVAAKALHEGRTGPWWQRESGRVATDVAYWDAVAALNTPAELHGWPGFDNQGNPMGEPALTARRDAFLREALDRLDHE